MARTMTYSEASSRFANLATTGIAIGPAIQEAVDRVYEMGRWPGTTTEIELVVADFVEDTDLNQRFVYFNEDTYDGVIGFRSDTRGWSIVDHISLYKDGVNMGDREFVDMGTDGITVAQAAATVTLDPAGDLNKVKLTANTAGTAGNDITVEIATPAVQATVDVAVVGNAITATPGTKARMVVSAASDPSVDGTELFYVGTGMFVEEIWASAGLVNPLSATPTGDGVRLSTDGSAACILQLYVSNAVTAAWADFSPGPWPDGDTLEIYTGDAVGDVFLVAGTSSAQQVIDAINAASTPVAASTSGTATGAVAVVAVTNLAGGTDEVVTSSRKYRCPLGWSASNGPYYALIKKESPVLSADTVIPIQSVGALKCAIQAVCYEYVNDEDRANLCWQKFDTFMKGAERQTHGPKRFTLGMDSSLKRKPRQFN